MSLDTPRHTVHKMDHTGRGVPQSTHETQIEATAAAREGKANATPSVLAGNIWYVSSRRADNTFMIMHI